MDVQLHHNSALFNKIRFPIILVCDRVSSPANIGSIFRVADSFGIQKIYFCGEAIKMDSNRMLRTSRNTHKIISYSQEAKIESVMNTLVFEGYTCFGLEITQNSRPIETFNFSPIEKIALIIGEERTGVSETILTKTERNFYINMYGTNSSMNVAMATAIALYEITRQRSILL